MLLISEPTSLLNRVIGLVNGFDYSILTFINSFAGRSWYFDNLVRFICDSQVIKSGLIVATLWWFWFRPADDRERQAVRKKVVAALFAAVIALFLARFLALVFPFRARPIAEAALGFRSPLGESASPLMGWSAFPSDHAVLFFSLAMSIWYLSKRLGWVLFGYVFVVICLPRIYLGVHYPSDILIGAPIGIMVAWFFGPGRLRDALAANCVTWVEKSPSWAYAVFFILSYEIAELFDQTRAAARFVYIFIRHLLAK